MNTSKLFFVLACVACFVCSFVGVVSYAENHPRTRDPLSLTHEAPKAPPTKIGVPTLDLVDSSAVHVVTIAPVVISAPRRAKVAPKASATRGAQDLAWGCKPSEGLLSDERGTVKRCGWFPAPQ